MMELNKIHNIDCLEFMKSMPDNCVDLVVTDPPYEIHTKGGGLGKRPVYQNGNLDKISKGFDIETTFREIQRVSKKLNLFCFCSNAQLPKIMMWGLINGFNPTALVWHKLNPPKFSKNVWLPNAEFIVHIRERGSVFQGNYKLKSKVESIPIPRKRKKNEKKHCAEKPLVLIKKYIEVGSNENDVVFDPFMGSGTTAVACKELNRNFIGCEIESEYCEMAEKRLRETIKGLL